MTQTNAPADEVIYCLVVDRSLHEIVPILQVPNVLDGKWSFPKGVAPLRMEARANSTLITLRSVEDLVTTTKGWFELFSDPAALHINYAANSRLFNQCDSAPGDFIIIDGDGDQRVYGRKVNGDDGEKFHMTFTLKNRLPED